MPRLLQIDSCLGVLSTGRITEGIAALAMDQGWECHIAHGARYVGTSKMISYQVGSKSEEYLHYAKSLLFDRHGLGSVSATKRLIEKIEKEIKPDIIHLHCIHGYYLNYKVLFEYLNQIEIPVVWTFHDCWAFTGHCAYFDSIDCNKWKTCCKECELLCQYPKSFIIDNSERNYLKKKQIFTIKKNLTIVPVSEWLEALVKQSFFYQNNVMTIHNGLDLSLFRSDGSRRHVGRKLVLGVAAVWDDRKGLPDFIKLREKLGDGYEIVLVGLNDSQIKSLPPGITVIKKTHDVYELIHLYSSATVFVNPTYSDNFPTTNLEALACGTPVITYNTGGSPEAIDKSTGIIVHQGDVEALAEAIQYMSHNPMSSEDCRTRAIENFDQNKCYMKYLELYERLIAQKKEGLAV